MISSRKDRLLTISIILSLLSIVITIFINVKISKEYLRVDGKTKALFSITELLQFGYQYYFGVLGVVSLILSLSGLQRRPRYGKTYLAIILSGIALVIVFARIWRLFI